MHPVQRRVPVRRAARVCAARGRVATGDGALRACEAPSRAAAAGTGCRPREGPVVHARGARPGPARAGLVPARRPVEGRDAGRGREGGAGGGAPAGEPGGVLPRRRRLPRVPRAARCRRGRGADRGHVGQGSRPSRRPLALHARPAARPGRRRPRASLRAEDDRPHEHRRRRPARRRSPVAPYPHAAASTCPSTRADAKLRYRSPSVPARVDDDVRAASGSRSTSRPTPLRADRRPCSTKTTSSWAPASSWPRPRNIRA